MSFPRPVKAVVFDMDGLLVATEQVVFAAMQHAAASFGGEMPFATFQRMVGLRHEASDLILMEHFGEGFDLPAFSAAVSVYFRTEQAAGIALKAGVVEILDRLDALKLPRAIATSSSRYAVEQSLGPHGLLPRFDAFITREAQEKGKPHPEPFLKAAAALGVDPASCLALEDSHNGVRSASSAGMMTVMVPDMLDPTEEMETLTVRIAADLHEVAALLAGQAV
ncbi:HAD family phosphatase [Phenylobacterium sp.]|jgi:HAD superfamily hydrolase (TIGR01509 family)|uniref:HAD family hydrolase n=1 Tax=Phenylobacterium sp. TaxID=1871053 RepID=UPI002F3E4BAC